VARWHLVCIQKVAFSKLAHPLMLSAVSRFPFHFVCLIKSTGHLAVQLFDSKKIGIGQLDFLDTSFTNDARLTVDMVEKWWCIGNTENRVGMWVQGTKLA
jgi:hypothetical protein